MTLDELLRELRENVLRDDAELASGPDDRLWSDETLIRYINDAQWRFARKTLSLRDASTPEVVEVPLVAGVSTYDLHDSILAVVSGKYDTDTTDLTRVGRTLLAAAQPVTPELFTPSSEDIYPPGRPVAFATDETTVIDTQGGMSMRVWPTPSAAEAGKLITLCVARTPLAKFSVDDMTAECEIHDMYVLDMLSWAAYRALLNSDIDGHAANADRHEARFEKAALEVLRDVRRKLRAPIRWLHGQGGFTWRS